MAYEWLGLLIIVLVVGVVAAWVSARPWSPAVRRLVILGLVVRVAGSMIRYEVLYRVYGGVGDASGYFGYGQAYAAALWAGDFSIFGAENWFSQQWWGTQFVRYVSGFVVAIVGPSMRAGFVVFSLFSFAGLCMVGLAFHRAYPHVRVERFLPWLFFLPSLWFWPSSIGKDAILVLGLGFVTLGYVGRRGRIDWLPLLAGLAISATIRPHVTAAMVVVVAFAEWLTPLRHLTVGRAIQAVAMAILAVFVLRQALAQLGLDPGDLEGIQEFAQMRSGLTERGGSNVGGSGGLAIPMAVVNVLFRPFLFEAHNVPSLMSAMELTVFWGLAWLRRRRILLVIKAWRHDRLLRFGVLMTGVYTLMIGLVMANLGIIARQRAVILPLLLILLEAYPVYLYARARRRRAERESSRHEVIGGAAAAAGTSR